MEAEIETSTSDVKGLTEHHNNKQHTLNLAALVQDLKYDIATIVTETQALFKQQVLLMQNNNPLPLLSLKSNCKPVWVFLVELDLE